MKIKFKGKIRKGGNSFKINVPKAYLLNGQLEVNKKYSITVEDEEE